MRYLTVVIPAKDEQEIIEETLNNLFPFIDREVAEVLVVNDHSGDETAEIVERLKSKHPYLRLVDNLRPAGFANALRTGFEDAKGRFVVPFMADSCDDPKTLNKMIERSRQGYDLVCGSRYIPGGKRIGGPRIQGFFSRFVGVTLSYFSSIPTRDAGNAFKMYRREALLSLDLKEEGFAISMEACIKFFLAGHRICDVPTVWYGRKKGKSKFRLSKTLPYARLYFAGILRKKPLSGDL